MRFSPAQLVADLTVAMGVLTLRDQTFPDDGPQPPAVAPPAGGR